MPRFPRKYLETNFFHVITQGINKEYIFEQENDIKMYIKSMYKISREENVKIIAYCIMNNHAHLLLETESIPKLSKFMHRLNTKYGYYYNNKYNKVGYVFRDRFKSEGIYNEVQLYNCIKYIYNNPVKAGMCKYPNEYPYSNYKIIEKNIGYGNFNFIDIDDEKTIELNQYVDNYIKDEKINLLKWQEKENVLIKLIISLKDDYNISLREISKMIGLGRETIRNLYNKNQ